MLPAEKQNIVYTNRRSKETQDILDKILKSPQEIKVDKDKEEEARNASSPHSNHSETAYDKEALELEKRNNSFKGHTPKFLLLQAEPAPNCD